MSPPHPSLEQVVAGIALLSCELNFTGRMIFEGLDKPMQSLKSGRAPRALGIAQVLSDLDPLRQSLLEILQELGKSVGALATYRQQFGQETLGEPTQAAESEFRYWQAYSDRVQILLKKLTLIAELEKLSPLGRAPLQDAWDEVQALALRSNKPS
jgi:hypothetical protein